MKTSYKLLMLALMAVVLVNCTGEIKYETLESGISYRFVDKNEGEKAKDGDIMVIDMVNQWNDSVLFQSNPETHMIINPNRAPQILKEVLDLCSEGDSMQVKFTLKQYAELTRMPLTDDMDTSETVSMQLRVREIENETAYLERLKSDQLREDRQLIEKYLSENNLEAEQTEDGLYYVIEKAGSGAKPEDGQEVHVNYVLQLLDGKHIDTSLEDVARDNGIFNERREYKPFSFTLGRRQVIQGWDKGIALLNKGTKARLLIPSGLGYGPNARPGSPIPANAVLIFDVELVDIK